MLENAYAMSANMASVKIRPIQLGREGFCA
jgi:hypothetical protein